jgi:formylglycine-generating enzyme required for sulfatase activity
LLVASALAIACSDRAILDSSEPTDGGFDADVEPPRDATRDRGSSDVAKADDPRIDRAAGEDGVSGNDERESSSDGTDSSADGGDTSADGVDASSDGAIDATTVGSNDADAANETGSSDDALDPSDADAAEAVAIDSGSDGDGGSDPGDAASSGNDADAPGEPRFDNPSCVGLAAACGPSQSQDCCHRATISGGAFLRSYDGVGFTDPSYPATIGTFQLDTFEVTVGRFRAFVDAGFGTQTNSPASGSGALPTVSTSGWNAGDNVNLEADTTALRAALKCSAPYDTWTDTPSSNETRPINCVTWYEAFAFCIWDGARLPSEAEWNYAAAGGNEQRVYPWSVPPTAASVSETYASYWLDSTRQCFGDGMDGCALSDLITVGSKPSGRGRWGQADLGGNVWEWTRDTFSNPYAIDSCSNCADLSRGAMKSIRGGSFFGTSSTLLASGRAQGVAATRYYTVGIRCAR